MACLHEPSQWAQPSSFKTTIKKRSCCLKIMFMCGSVVLPVCLPVLQENAISLLHGLCSLERFFFDSRGVTFFKLHKKCDCWVCVLPDFGLKLQNKENNVFVFLTSPSQLSVTKRNRKIWFPLIPLIVVFLSKFCLKKQNKKTKTKQKMCF